MIGQTISQNELTLLSLSKIKEGRNNSADASPSLIFREGEQGDEFESVGSK
jgi:hypothetical protein